MAEEYFNLNTIPHDVHSPIIEKLGKIVIIESKSISEYLKQLEEIGEEISEYSGLYGYSIGKRRQEHQFMNIPNRIIK